MFGSVTQRLRHSAAILGLATIYFVAARLGLMMDAVAGFATLVWPPTGIALAALLLGGYRLWPGILIGAFVANLSTGAPLLAALGIGVGNTLEAVVGTYLLRRIPGFRPSLDRLRDVLGLIVLAAGVSTIVSATIGVSTLYLAGIVSGEQVGEAWQAWWVGDLIADLVIAPVLLVWATTPRFRPAPRQSLEAAALVASVLGVCLFVFGSPVATDTTTVRWGYLVFPPLIWAALRFGQHGAVSMTLLTSLVAIWGTASGYGPFARPVLHESLLTLQTFLGVAAATFMVLGASIAERRRADAELRRAHDAVADANRAKSEFLAVMSHELRTPLNAISGYVELMSAEMHDPITETQRTYLSRIRSNQRQLLLLIEDVLSFAKVEAGHLSVAIQTVLVRDILQAVESLVEPELRRKQLSFASDPYDPALAVRADPEKLRQILLNLVANAVKFTAPGGRIEVGAARERDSIRMWISDTGIGIPADQLERVFEPFFQVDRGLTRSYPGVGLGLAIARDFARAMGGEVRVDSEAGRGTIASLELPVAESAATPGLERNGGPMAGLDGARDAKFHVPRHTA
jgi:signal transduction histidine kinase